MSAHVSKDGWVLIAGVVTIVHVAAMRWCMPTPKTKQRITLAPFAGLILLVPNAMVKGYSLSFTLYLYCCVLLGFVVLLVPVRKKVMADTLEQEQKPWDKVPLNTATLYWMPISITVCIIGAVLLWPVLK
ncbi:hypothetical protein ACFVYV_28410 [Streptomyces mirabilis]|uniref:hypothetical protein n=1 Tax=Streptomyces mirabilis TaxID=68239 RepID=UPI0036DE74A7